MLSAAKTVIKAQAKNHQQHVNAHALAFYKHASPLATAYRMRSAGNQHQPDANKRAHRTYQPQSMLRKYLCIYCLRYLAAGVSVINPSCLNHSSKTLYTIGPAAQSAKTALLYNAGYNEVPGFLPVRRQQKGRGRARAGFLLCLFASVALAGLQNTMPYRLLPLRPQCVLDKPQRMHGYADISCQTCSAIWYTLPSLLSRLSTRYGGW